MEKQLKVGIFIFDDVEILDFAGPYEVFSLASTEDGYKLFEVSTVSENGNMITARNGLRVHPKYRFNNMPEFDILIIPGGLGARGREINNEKVIQWIKKQIDNVQIMASVCTGAFLLAKAGLLDGKRATTHWASLDRLKTEFPKVCVEKNVKFVDEGNIISSAGISAGINMSFYIVKRLLVLHSKLLSEWNMIL